MVLAISPEHPRAHNGLGNALRNLGRTREAIDAFREALARNRDSAAISKETPALISGEVMLMPRSG